MSSEDIVEEVADASEESLTDEQQEAMLKLDKMFNLKVRAALAAILDGVSYKYTKKQSKIKKRKDGKPTRYEQGWLDATSELFDSVYQFLYALESAEFDKASNEVEVVSDENFDLFKAVEEANSEEK
jgi:hypothetical protein